ncbi:MAG TPA: acetyl-CoA synthetase, partial [Thermoplasmatales archaeon]|nr:acetyl-CoA synthetase [Thermoplasmatales archaeon]
LLKLSKMAEEIKIKQLDLNPIFLYEKGCVAVDAKIILEE